MNGISAVLVAAGGSRRLGRPKQLLTLEGETLVRRTARAALEAGVDELVVVVGAERARVEAALADLDLRLVVNERWRDGMGSSISAGARACTGPAILVLTCDQPGVDAGLIRRMIEAMRAGHARVACAYAGVVGVPASFSDPEDIAALQALEGDRGARHLLRDAGADVFEVAADVAAFDVDDESDWRRREWTDSS